MFHPLPRAEQLFRTGRFLEARRVLLECLAQNPERSEVHRLLALTHLRLGDDEAADAAAREGIRLAPADAFAHYVHALVLLERGRVDEAPLRLAEAIRLAPGDADLHALEAAMRAAWKEWPAAERAAERALTIDPTHASALDTKAAVWLERGRPAEAEEVVRRALARSPDDARLHRRLGEILERRGAPSEAAEAYATATRIDPTDDAAAAALTAAERAGAPRTGLLHAALSRLDEWRRSRGAALLLLAPFVAISLHVSQRDDRPLEPLLPLPFVEWGFLGVLLVVFGASSASTLLWSRSSFGKDSNGGRATIPPGTARRAVRSLAAVGAALVTALLLVGAGPARTLPGLLWLVADDLAETAAAHPPGASRRRLSYAARGIATLPLVAVVAGLVAPPLPVTVSVVSFLAVWTSAVFARRTS